MKEENSHLEIKKNYTSEIGAFLSDLSKNKETNSQAIEREKHEQIAVKRDVAINNTDDS